jgi:serine/threonine protein phosphatase PrpC
MMIEYAVFTDVGEKEKNEDAVKVFINPSLSTYGFVLADGLGGHGNGEIASNFAVECAGAAIENTDGFSGEFIDQCFGLTQDLLMEEKERSGLHSIKTTMVLLLITKDFARWGHIGDSRLYLFRNGKVMRRTFDHSVPQMLAASGQIRERDIRRHPDRNVLLRALGSEWDSPMHEVDERGLRIRKGDAFLLCSDGFWEWIEEKSILRILKKALTAHEALQEMTAEVTANGAGRGMDNLSAILVDVK